MKRYLLAAEDIPSFKKTLNSLRIDQWAYLAPAIGFPSYIRRLNNVKRKLPNPTKVRVERKDLEEKMGGLFKRLFRKGKMGWPENKEVWYDIEKMGGRNVLMVHYHLITSVAIGYGLYQAAHSLIQILNQ